jgi:hypothetical protein
MLIKIVTIILQLIYFLISLLEGLLVGGLEFHEVVLYQILLCLLYLQVNIILNIDVQLLHNVLVVLQQVLHELITILIHLILVPLLKSPGERFIGAGRILLQQR